MDDQTTQNLQQYTQGQAGLGMFGRRIGRLGFFLGFTYILAFFIVPLMLQFIVGFVFNGNGSGLSTLVNIICLVFATAGVILMFPVLISLYVRRLHDVNQSGLLTLLVLVPLVNLFLFLYLLFAPGTQGYNGYGQPVNSLSYWVVLGFKKPQ